MNPNELMTDAELDAIGFTFSLQTFDTPQGKRQFAREAIAAALVKLTQGQEPEWYHGVDRHGVNCFYHKDEVRPSEFSTPLYTHPDPSQQENRKPLTDEQWEAIAREVYNQERFTREDEVWHNFHWLKKFKTAIEAAHNIKEK